MSRPLPMVKNVLRILPRESIDELARVHVGMHRPHQHDRPVIIDALLKEGDSHALRQVVFNELGNLLGFSKTAQAAAPVAPAMAPKTVAKAAAETKRRRRAA